MPPPRVRNAADRADVNRARRHEQRQAERQLAVVRAVQNTVEGRAWNYTLAEHLHTFHSILTLKPNQIYAAAGQQEAGFALLAELLEADPITYDLMFQEARARAVRDAADLAAARAQPTEEPTDA